MSGFISAKNAPVLIILGVVALVVLFSSLFTVHQAQQALVLQFGEPQRVIREPGLNMKIPLIQNVSYYDKRLLSLDPPVEQVILADQKRLDVDTFSRYVIVDPLKFYQTVRTEQEARQQLFNIVNAKTRDMLGQVTLSNVLSPEREDIMQRIRQAVNDEAADLGIDIVDVRLRRADLPDETSNAILRRMISEREREAREFRAQGREQSEQIRARADRERTVLLAETEREAQIMRGEGDAEAIRIFAEAFNKDAEFFAFYRSLEAYRTALDDPEGLMVLSPDSEFFRYFESDRAKR